MMNNQRQYYNRSGNGTNMHEPRQYSGNLGRQMMGRGCVDRFGEYRRMNLHSSCADRTDVRDFEMSRERCTNFYPQTSTNARFGRPRSLERKPDYQRRGMNRNYEMTRSGEYIPKQPSRNTRMYYDNIQSSQQLVGMPGSWQREGQTDMRRASLLGPGSSSQGSGGQSQPSFWELHRNEIKGVISHIFSSNEERSGSHDYRKNKERPNPICSQEKTVKPVRVDKSDTQVTEKMETEGLDKHSSGLDKIVREESWKKQSLPPKESVELAADSDENSSQNKVLQKFDDLKISTSQTLKLSLVKAEISPPENNIESSAVCKISAQQDGTQSAEHEISAQLESTGTQSYDPKISAQDSRQSGKRESSVQQASSLSAVLEISVQENSTQSAKHKILAPQNSTLSANHKISAQQDTTQSSVHEISAQQDNTQVGNIKISAQQSSTQFAEHKILAPQNATQLANNEMPPQEESLDNGTQSTNCEISTQQNGTRSAIFEISAEQGTTHSSNQEISVQQECTESSKHENLEPQRSTGIYTTSARHIENNKLSTISDFQAQSCESNDLGVCRKDNSVKHGNPNSSEVLSAVAPSGNGEELKSPRTPMSDTTQHGTSPVTTSRNQVPGSNKTPNKNLFAQIPPSKVNTGKQWSSSDYFVSVENPKSSEKSPDKDITRTPAGNENKGNNSSFRSLASPQHMNIDESEDRASNDSHYTDTKTHNSKPRVIDYQHGSSPQSKRTKDWKGRAHFRDHSPQKHFSDYSPKYMSGERYDREPRGLSPDLHRRRQYDDRYDLDLQRESHRGNYGYNDPWDKYDYGQGTYRDRYDEYYREDRRSYEDRWNSKQDYDADDWERSSYATDRCRREQRDYRTNFDHRSDQRDHRYDHQYRSNSRERMIDYYQGTPRGSSHRNRYSDNTQTINEKRESNFRSRSAEEKDLNHSSSREQHNQQRSTSLVKEIRASTQDTDTKASAENEHRDKYSELTDQQKDRGTPSKTDVRGFRSTLAADEYNTSVRSDLIVRESSTAKEKPNKPESNVTEKSETPTRDSNGSANNLSKNTEKSVQRTDQQKSHGTPSKSDNVRGFRPTLAQDGKLTAARTGSFVRESIAGKEKPNISEAKLTGMSETWIQNSNNSAKSKNMGKSVKSDLVTDQQKGHGTPSKSDNVRGFRPTLAQDGSSITVGSGSIVRESSAAKEKPNKTETKVTGKSETRTQDSNIGANNLSKNIGKSVKSDHVGAWRVSTTPMANLYGDDHMERGDSYNPKPHHVSNSDSSYNSRSRHLSGTDSERLTGYSHNRSRHSSRGTGGSSGATSHSDWHVGLDKQRSRENLPGSAQPYDGNSLPEIRLSGRNGSQLREDKLFRTIPFEEENRYEGSDLDIDLEDSDDELETPFFLTSLTEASSRPIPSTPTKNVGGMYTDSPVPGGSPQYNSVSTNYESTLFSLDSLLKETTEKSDQQRKFEKDHAELEAGIRRGGFVKDTLEKEEDPEVSGELLPEHQVSIQQFEVSKSVMSDVHPGEEIFNSQRFQRLFTSSVTPARCGFVPGTSLIDKHLSTLQPECFTNLLTSDIMLMCFNKLSCPDAVLRWLLFIMSTHTSHLVLHGCQKIIDEHLHSQKYIGNKSKPSWSPAVNDVLSVLCNYGAEPSDFLPRMASFTEEDLFRDIPVLEARENNEMRGGYNRENFRLVLHTLANAFQTRARYSGQELTQLLTILSRAALDKSLCNNMLTYEFQVVIASILKLYSESDWNSQSPSLCRLLSSLTSHHHNRMYLCQLLPPTTRGSYLQRRVSFCHLQHLFFPDRKIIDLHIQNFKLKLVHNVLPVLQGLSVTDVYKMASAVSLLDMCVGNGLIKSAEKDDIEYLTEQMKKITGDVRDNVQDLDRTRVKDMMIRVTSKWSLALLSVGSKQETLFSYTKRKSPPKITIEKVSASQSDNDDQSSQSEGEDNFITEEEENRNLVNSALCNKISRLQQSTLSKFVTETNSLGSKEVKVEKMDDSDVADKHKITNKDKENLFIEMNVDTSDEEMDLGQLDEEDDLPEL